MKTGTSVSATLSRLLRTACIAAVLPKKISRGGRLRGAGGSAWLSKVIFSYRRWARTASLQYGSHMHVERHFSNKKEKKEEFLGIITRPNIRIDVKIGLKYRFCVKFRGHHGYFHQS